MNGQGLNQLILIMSFYDEICFDLLYTVLHIHVLIIQGLDFGMIFGMVVTLHADSRQWLEMIGLHGHAFTKSWDSRLTSLFTVISHHSNCRYTIPLRL